MEYYSVTKIWKVNKTYIMSEIHQVEYTLKSLINIFKIKGYYPHELHVELITKRKYAISKYQYGSDSRNDIMKLDLCPSWSHNYFADANKIMFEVCKVSQSWRFWQKESNNWMEIQRKK